MESGDCVGLWTLDEELADVVGSVAAAAGAELVRIDDPAAARGLLLVGADVAGGEAWRRLPPGAQAVLVGEDSGAMAQASMAWGARVVALPEGRAWLATLLAGRTRATAGRIVVLLGGGGGVGTSTVATGLAGELQRRGRRVALLDADPASGGIDLLLGAEGVPGWRWSSLLGATGELGQLAGGAVVVDGLTVVSHGRSGDSPGPTALRSVAHALQRDHDVLVVDAGRCPEVLATLPQVDRLVVAVDGRVSSVASVNRLLAVVGSSRAGLALRCSAMRAVEITDSLGLPSWAVLPEDGALRRAADVGVAPRVAAGRRWQRAIASLARAVEE